MTAKYCRAKPSDPRPHATWRHFSKRAVLNLSGERFWKNENINEPGCLGRAHIWAQWGHQPFLISICFCFFCASGVFGRVTVNTPFLNIASIFSPSTPSGTLKDRWKEP
jgi:hypothetical protein